MLISVEGLDASGKATVTKAIVNHFQARNIEAKRTEFPAYKTNVGQAILDILQGKTVFERRRAEVLQSLMTINRYEFIGELTHYSSRGYGYTDQLLVCDRYRVSAEAYGTMDGLDIEWVRKINSELPYPCLNILVDITVEESFRRRPERRDMNEANAEYLNRVRTAYLDIFRNEQNDRWVVIDGMKEPQFVLADALKEIEKASGGRIHSACSQ